jgi:hypothetical protein
MFKTIFPLLWEFWRPNRWRFLMAFLAMLIAPAFLIFIEPFQREWHSRQLDWWSQMGAICVNFAICSLTVGYWVGFPARHYTLPISIRQLAWIRLLPGAATCSGFYLLIALLFNTACNAGFPYVGPALTYGVGYLLGYAAISRVYGRENLRTLAGLIVGVLVGIWICGHYDIRWNFGPSIRWPGVTVVELALLGFVSLTAWWITESGFALDRKGNGWAQASVQNAESTDSEKHRCYRLKRFRSPFAALFWQEWRQDGWLWPTALSGTYCLIAVVTFIALTFHQEPLLKDASDSIVVSMLAFMAFGTLLPCFLGVFTAQGRKSQVDKPLPTSIATLPVSDATLAWVAILRSLCSVAMSWLLVALIGCSWMLCHFAYYGEFNWSGFGMGAGQNSIPTAVAWTIGWGLFCAWFTTGVGTATGLSGRSWIVFLPVAYFPIWIASAALIYSCFQRPAADAIAFMATTVLLLVIPIGSCAGYVRAWRRNVIGIKTLLAGEAILILVEGLLIQWWFTTTVTSVPTGVWEFLQFSSFLAVAAAPPAIVPLAVHFNRHR